MNILEIAKECGGTAVDVKHTHEYWFKEEELQNFAQAVIENYKDGLVPVGIFKGDFKGAVNGKVEMSVIALNGIPETGTQLYALQSGETK